MCGTTLFQNPATARTAGSCERIGATKAPVLSPAILSIGGFTLDSGGKRVPTVVTDFCHTVPARVAKFLWWARCRPAPIRPTQRLTRPNGAVLSPPSRRRSSLCQQHRDPGIEWTCISSLCPSASRPSKVGPGFRPELRPVYSQTRCLSCSNR